MTIDVASAMQERAVDGNEAGVTRCPSCVHPLDAHDVIATRFCAATTTRALARGCACRR
jgi:hypothetical protein